MRQPRPSSPRRLNDDGGAVIIEAALVLPVIMMFIAGTIDFGIGFRDRTLIQSAVRNGARVGASSVNNPTADQLALSTMYAGLVDMQSATIDKAIIYKANGLTNGQPSTTCKNIVKQPTGAGNTTQNCNVYQRSQILAAAGVSGTWNGATITFTGTPPVAQSACTNGWNQYWCAGGANNTSNERHADLSGTLDSFGMYVEVKYVPFTGVFGIDEMIIADSAVMRMEPKPG